VPKILLALIKEYTRKIGNVDGMTKAEAKIAGRL